MKNNNSKLNLLKKELTELKKSTLIPATKIVKEFTLEEQIKKLQLKATTNKKVKMNSIYNEDCLVTMQKMPDNFIDLVVTSPPYDNLRSYGGNSYFSFENVARELYRVLKPGGTVVWVVGDKTIHGSESGASFQEALYFKSIGFNLNDTMIYKKNNYINPSKIRYFQSFEYIFIFTKGKPKSVHLLADRKNNTAGQKIHGTQRTVDGRLIKKSGIGKTIKQYGIRGNIWSYTVGGCHSTKDKVAYQHPAIMPEQLAHDQILSWSNENDIVYDPFAGSGTTGKVAKALNRKFILSEIQKEYVSIIHQRFNIL